MNVLLLTKTIKNVLLSTNTNSPMVELKKEANRGKIYHKAEICSIAGNHSQG